MHPYIHSCTNTLNNYLNIAYARSNTSFEHFNGSRITSYWNHLIFHVSYSLLYMQNIYFDKLSNPSDLEKQKQNKNLVSDRKSKGE